MENHELMLTEPVYVRAMVHYIVTVLQHHSHSSAAQKSRFDFSAWLRDWTSLEQALEAQCQAPLQSVDGLLVVAAQDFITGTVQLSRAVCCVCRDASLDDAREMLYGSDQITP
jgi:hypothetical protein